MPTARFLDSGLRRNEGNSKQQITKSYSSQELMALVLKLKVNLTRFHGVFTRNNNHRRQRARHPHSATVR
jgi:hypothetical protein